ncbi:sulfite exporter TauE/SafE family protein [Thalassospira marina]|uniref:Probable membrane transporter protein n=1 Tax=Thalassospira marina TaxID=2048283 RepID=A0A2N3KJK4_9PROT|nr:sulfite exporter TauE/SafE family protein [Thalassospira marina]PKR50725.1 permease [Thalassospira marina]
MTASYVAIVLLGAFAGGFVNGLAGFGTGLVALGIWLHVIDPLYGAPLVAICSVAGQLQTLPAIWHAVNIRRLLPMLVGGVLGIPVGILLLGHMAPDLFRLSLGLFLIAFAIFMMFNRALPAMRWGGKKTEGMVGFCGGILGGLAGLSGPLPTIWATLKRWEKDERRSVFQMFNLTILACVAISHLAIDGITVAFSQLVLIALPGTFIGAFAGIRLYRRLSDHRYNLLVLIMLAISGITLVVSEIG